jgi:dipeptidyl aminopeptidase/acylaminoacyl peptidase
MIALTSAIGAIVMALAPVAAASAAAAPAAARAEDVKPLRIEHAVAAKDFHVQGRLAAISPDNALAAYTVCDPRRIIVQPGNTEGRAATTNAAYRSMGCDVWTSPLAGGAATNLTPDAGNNWGPVWSLDGTQLAFYSDRGGAPHVWLWDRATRKSRMLAAASTRTWLAAEVPIWTPDGRQIIAKLFPEGMTQAQLDDEAGTPQAGASGGAGGTTRGGTQAGAQAGTQAETQGVAKQGSATQAATVKILRSGAATGDAQAGTPRAGEGRATPSLLNNLLADLAAIDVASGRVHRLAPGVRTATLRLSPDGRQLLFLEDRGQEENGVRRRQALALVDLAGGPPRDLVTGISQNFQGAVNWSPDGRWIAYTTAADAPAATGARITAPDAGLTQADLFIVASAGGAPERFSGAPAGAFSSDFLPPLWDETSTHLFAIGDKAIWRGDVATRTVTRIAVTGVAGIRRLLSADDGRRVWTGEGGGVYVLTADDKTKREGFARVDLASGAATRLLEEDARLDNLFSQPVVSRDGQHVVFVSERASASSDLWTAGADFRQPARLTTINPDLSSYTFGQSRLIDFRSADGDPLRATLLLPAGYEPGRRYPLVTWVYASAMGSRSPNSFGLVGYAAYNMHMLTTRGYAVMWPDIPVKIGSPMQDLMKAVMPALDRVVELGIADPDRLAVMGQSNGGYSTLSLLVQTNRFKAAVMNAGFGDLTAFYGSMTDNGSGSWVSWLEGRGGAMAAPPWEAPQRYVQNSPIYFLDRLQTPLIIQAGGADRAILPYSDQVFAGARRLNKDVTYLRYGGEGHTLAAYPNLVDYWNRVLAFFDRHLKQTADSSR